MQVAVTAALQQHLLEPTEMPMCFGKRAALEASGSCLCLVNCPRDRGLWGAPQDCELSMGLWDSAKINFHLSWDCACRFCSLCSPAALWVMNDTCMGPFSKTGQLTALSLVLNSLTSQTRVARLVWPPQNSLWPLLSPHSCQGIVSGSSWWPRPKSCQQLLWWLKFQCPGTI